VRTNTEAAGRFEPKLIDMAAGIDPRLRVERLEDVAGAWKHDQGAFTLLALGVIAVVASVLLLSAAGIYAMMSFTVASRRREIGIRAALGADPRHLLIGIFTRTAIQLGIGVAAGLAAAAVLDRVTGGDIIGGQALILLPGVVGVIFIVGLLATLGPARRALRLEPSEVLRAET
jgi:ABC-type antimicrobial peptide transport system permease subunit